MTIEAMKLDSIVESARLKKLNVVVKVIHPPQSDIGTEHLLLALLKNKYAAAEVLQKVGVRYEDVQQAAANLNSLDS